MNRRIKELLAKTNAFGPGGATVDRYNFSANDVQKFAELIVKDCIDKIAEENEKVNVNWQCSNGVHIYYELKKHFGVE